MEISAGTDPFELFQTWFDEAVTAEINDPDAIALASVNADGMPSVRMVLLRQWSEDGFLFFTNYQSRKSGELLATGKAAFCMHWKSLRKQVRVTGQVGKATAAQSDAYFNSRGRGSQIGAWASAQSQPLGSRAELMAQVEAHDKKFPDAVTRPPHWGGFCLVPEEIEFWADGEHRLHDRFRFTRADSGWDIQRLNP
ncbi:MAG: pyridoxamine 5'-phosphate oxidase [Candidatus Puniceispirillum sp.]|jgi:pyridoxamine 5'-phosphate oxidase|nr:pyridoxamine 5'-phosphate oxidase [Candidatus Puniceispirillum sp.]MBL6673874.1 pyridoxamine 5'-phosphate oxidase [Candidatus Puniceispirillum sp.]MCH1427223.1 pyridoxamine 5'-phosphate oxidase [Alphaproteobacteria bacterium]MDB2528174.1 pyridoxamine 5'-phosphate oxidase [Alphaproteobacteria bacterium]